MTPTRSIRSRLFAVVVAATALSRPSVAQEPAKDGTMYFPAEKTAAGWAKGGPLIETATFKVHTSRREGKPGEAEVHNVDSDIFYIIEGKATIVTGGTLVDGKTTAANEQRGPRIQGGLTRQVAKGDILIIPNGVPHWFSETSAPFLYYTVKVTSPSAAK
jgi:mannose-6-phosphate isomerase-like protein (cupin superfamily)